MIRLGLRLTLAGGREAVARLTVIAAAVAVGVGLLLISLAGINAVNTQNARYAWLNTGTGSATRADAAANSSSGGRSATPAPLWWLLRADMFHGQIVGRVEVAATGPDSPVPPGIPRLPGPDEFYASPALSTLLRSVPPAQLGDRYPGRQIGTIGPAALPAPNTLLIIVGDTAEHLAPQPRATRVTSIETTTPSNCFGEYCAVAAGIDASGIDLILSVVVLGLLFPVLIFIGTATRLSAARREQRFAAMRLVGATPRQVSVIAAVESVLAAVAGVAAGFGLFYALRPAAARYPFTGAPFFTSDLSLNLADILLVAVGVPVAAAVVVQLALRRVHISPLGVSRRVTPAAPRAWRLVPLLAGIAELAVVLAVGAPPTSVGQMEAYLPGFLLILAGLVTAGPWLTMAGARAMARRARRPAALIAARRLADDPRAGFRAISGLVLALFVSTVALAVITSIAANRSAPGGAIGSDVLFDQFTNGPADPGSVPALPATALADLRSIPGVQGVTEIHTNPLGSTVDLGRLEAIPAGLTSCAELARVPTLGQCPPGAVAAAVPAGGFVWNDARGPQSATVWPAADISTERLAALPVRAFAVGTDGSATAIEQARTLLEAAYPVRGGPPETIRESFSHNDTTEWQQLADVMILASLVVAGCTLTVSVVGGLSERRRPFSLLRLTGVPLGVLRRVVALESAVPLLVVALVSIAAAFVAAQLFLRAQMGYTLRPPGVPYCVTVLAGLAASLGIIAGTLPLLKRITGPETARNE
jgi:hypothetical protein